MGGGNRVSGKGGNRRWADDAWQRDLESCEKCGVGLKEQCRTSGGKPTRPHKGRRSRSVTVGQMHRWPGSIG